ncbi:hypothetical protein TYRP_011338 [Tyrophagus putrescentiae]|nr:hypothetical protein TYRP_011338 [Tyrophagus putrescentiae]
MYRRSKVQWTLSGLLAAIEAAILVVGMVLSESTSSSSTTSTTAAASSTLTTTLWPPPVSDCFEDVVEDGSVKTCKEECEKRYHPDDSEADASTSTASSSSSRTTTPSSHHTNHTISCYILYDTLECLDHAACRLCSFNESLLFHRSVRRKAKASRAVGGQCHGVADYKANRRSRCAPLTSPPPPDDLPTKASAIDKTSVVLLVLIVVILSVAIFAVLGIIGVMWWRHRSDFLLKTLREFGGGGGGEGAGRRRGSASSSACGYGPADFMSAKDRQARKTSPKGGGGGGGSKSLAPKLGRGSSASTKKTSSSSAVAAGGGGGKSRHHGKSSGSLRVKATRRHKVLHRVARRTRLRPPVRPHPPVTDDDHALDLVAGILPTVRQADRRRRLLEVNAVEGVHDQATGSGLEGHGHPGGARVEAVHRRGDLPHWTRLHHRPLGEGHHEDGGVLAPGPVLLVHRIDVGRPVGVAAFRVDESPWLRVEVGGAPPRRFKDGPQHRVVNISADHGPSGATGGDDGVNGRGDVPLLNHLQVVLVHCWFVIRGKGVGL